MSLSPIAILFALVSFVATFALARYLGKGFRKRQADKREAKAQEGLSRQVRRARERKKAPR